MSLLMQALRKAERARSQNGHEGEPEAGQEPPPFGQESVPSPPPMEGGPAFAVMPDAWRLEPLDAEPPVIPAQEAAHDPVPPQARHEPERAAKSAASVSAPGVSAPEALAASGAPAAAGGSPWAAEPAAGNSASAMPAGPGETAGAYGADRLYTNAGARTAGSRTSAEGVRGGGTQPPAVVPRAIASSQRRLMMLAGTLAALLAVFAFIYWRAVSGPGPGSRLPMVPMPAPGSPQAAQAGASQGGAIPVTPYVTSPAGELAAQGSPTGGGAANGGGAVPGAGAVAGVGAGPGGGAGAGGSGMAGGGAGTGGVAVAVGALEGQSGSAAPVTIPTPEQLAAIQDPAIRAEAMRDAAERAARQARTEGVASPSGGAPSGAVPSGTQSGVVTSGLTPSGAAPSAPSAVRPEGQPGTGPGAPPAISINRTPRQAQGPSAGPAESARAARRPPRSSAGTAATAAHNGEPLQTAIGENGDVRFVRGAAAAHVAPAVQNGYTALRQGDLARARQQYDQALLQDPTNRDALLGSAAVALREHDSKQAASNYLRLLELDPSDPEALAGLTELRPGDLQDNEIRLKGLARQHPASGPVQFALGNLFARQGRWPEAQQSYFRAYTAMPDNADYAYNLGVGLDRMNQPRLAQTYYRRALELAQSSPPAFNVDTVRKRLQVLETPPQ